MTDKKCDGNCCDQFFEGYDEVEDDYEIQRLEDIITICEFLIKTKKHRKDKREAFEKIFAEDEDEKESEEVRHNPYRIYTYRWPPRSKGFWDVPYWDRNWF